MTSTSHAPIQSSSAPPHQHPSHTNEIILKQYGSQEHLLVNIQNIKAYQNFTSSHQHPPKRRFSASNRDSKSDENSLPPYHIHVKVISYALSQYDVQCRTGKFAFLTRMGNTTASAELHTEKSTGNGTNVKSEAKSHCILRMGYEVYGKVLGCGNAVENVSQGDFVIGFLSMLLPNNAKYAEEGLVAIYEPELVAPVWHFLRVPPSLLLVEGTVGSSSGATNVSGGCTQGGVTSGTSIQSTIASNSSTGTLGKSQLTTHSTTNSITSAPRRPSPTPIDPSSTFVNENQLVGAILPGIRAYMAFSESCGQLKAGELVLITNAASPEAHVAVQVAANRGAKVFCAVKSEHEWNLVQDLGVDIVRVIDERREKLTEVILEETGGLGLDWLLDTHGSLKIDEIVPMMAPHSKILTTSVEAQYSMAICRQLLLKNVTLSFMCELTYVLSCTQQGKLMHMLKQIIDDLKMQRVRVSVHGVYTPEKIREAHRQLESGNVYGRVLLRYGM